MYIFSTLNDRGLQLSDSDIFKSKFYKYYTNLANKITQNSKERENFIEKNFSIRWKKLEELCSSVFRMSSSNPMDELFSRYMYYERSKRGIKDTTTISLRKFYENPDAKSLSRSSRSENSKVDKYYLLNEQTFENLITLANFWDDVYAQNNSRFSEEVLRKLFVLKYAPNNLWTALTSVYFMANKDDQNQLDSAKFETFLEKITAFIFAYAIVRPGVNALRTPVYSEMVKLTNGEDVDFRDFKFDIENTTNMFLNFSFYNMRPVTKAMLFWWTFYNPNQTLPKRDLKYQIEHIFANNRPSDALSDKIRESLGNKSLLERRINIRASDYRFCDKKQCYIGTRDQNEKSDGTHIDELRQLANENNDFTEQDIVDRNEKIISSFMDFLKKNDLAK